MNSLEENNKIIRVISDQISIFRGEACSTLKLNVKLEGLQDPVKQYYLDALVERTVDGVTTCSSCIKGVKFEFHRDPLDDPSKCKVSGKKNRLTCHVNEGVFSSNEKFRIVVQAYFIDEDDGTVLRLYHGVSQRITAADYAFCIQEEYTNIDPAGDGRGVVWYNAFGGKDESLEASVFIKCASGTLDTTFTQTMMVELVYADETSIPASRKRKKKVTGQQRLLNILKPAPEEQKIESTSFTTDLRFRIEEVTFHHAERGLKVRVFARTLHETPGAQQVIIHPAISDRTIHVLSKPKKRARKLNTEQYKNTDQVNETDPSNWTEEYLTKEVYMPTLEDYANSISLMTVDDLTFLTF
jgi:hypothetical protein